MTNQDNINKNNNKNSSNNKNNHLFAKHSKSIVLDKNTSNIKSNTSSTESKSMNSIRIDSNNVETSKRKSKSKNFKTRSLAFRKTASIEMLRRHFYDPNVMGYDEETLYKLTQNQVQEFFPEHFSVSVLKTDRNGNQTRKIKNQNSRFEWKKVFSNIFCGSCFNIKTFIIVTLWISFFVFVSHDCVTKSLTSKVNNTDCDADNNNTDSNTYSNINKNTIKNINMRIIDRFNDSNQYLLLKRDADGDNVSTINNDNQTNLYNSTIDFDASTVTSKDKKNKDTYPCVWILCHVSVIAGGIILYFILTFIYTYQLYVIWTTVPWYLIECIAFGVHALMLCATSSYITAKDNTWRKIFSIITLIDSCLSLVIVLANLCFYFTGATPLIQYYANLKTGYNPIDKIFAREKMESFVNWVKQQNYKTKRTVFNENKSPEISVQQN